MYKKAGLAPAACRRCALQNGLQNIRIATHRLLGIYRCLASAAKHQTIASSITSLQKSYAKHAERRLLHGHSKIFLAALKLQSLQNAISHIAANLKTRLLMHLTCWVLHAAL